jgi:hypothetical protein
MCSPAAWATENIRRGSSLHFPAIKPVPSFAHTVWTTTRLRKLDRIDGLRRRIGRGQRRRKQLTEQLAHTYVVLLSSHFQGFTRDLHDECASFLAQQVSPPMHNLFRSALVVGREIDWGNATVGSVSKSFSRFDLAFKTEIMVEDARCSGWLADYELLLKWRNAIAHEDFDPVKLGKVSTLTMRQVQVWRQACCGIADSLDKAMHRQLKQSTNVAPW